MSFHTSNTTKLNPRRILIPSAAALLLIIGVCWFIRPNFNAPKLPPAELASTAINNLLAAESLSFSSQSQLLLGDDAMELGQLKGEIAGADFHVEGQVLGAPLNIYQIGSKTYRQDTLTDQWLTLEDGRLLEDAALMSEINPRAAFDLTALGEVSEAQVENLAEEKCYKLSFQPQTAAGYYEKYFASLSCSLSVTLDDHQLRQAQIDAEACANGIDSVLQLTLEFWDWNKTAPIEPPIVE